MGPPSIGCPCVNRPMALGLLGCRVCEPWVRALSFHLVIPRARRIPDLVCNFEGAAWRNVAPLMIEHFHPRSSSHRPVARAKLIHTSDALCAIFQVRDRFVRSICLNYQDSVCRDSCVELFVQPRKGRGYFNFEVNCGGTMLLYYIEDPSLVAKLPHNCTPVAVEHALQVRIATTMPRTTPVEIQEPVEWQVQMTIPFHVLEEYAGRIGDICGKQWRGNLYKCADDSSHPHWASWAPVGEELNFHQPDRFGVWEFE